MNQSINQSIIITSLRNGVLLLGVILAPRNTVYPYSPELYEGSSTTRVTVSCHCSPILPFGLVSLQLLSSHVGMYIAVE